MAKWGEKFSRATQAAISKSKEMAEVTRLNVEISTYTQNMKELYTQVGEYVIKEGLLPEDEEVANKRKEIETLQVSIQLDTDKVNEIRSSKFCDRCGAEMNRDILLGITENENVCKNCGAPLVEGAVFCGNCGSKQE